MHAVCCLGTMTFGKQNSEAEAHEQLSYATDAGINFLVCGRRFRRLGVLLLSAFT